MCVVFLNFILQVRLETHENMASNKSKRINTKENH